MAPNKKKKGGGARGTGTGTGGGGGGGGASTVNPATAALRGTAPNAVGSPSSPFQAAAGSYGKHVYIMMESIRAWGSDHLGRRTAVVQMYAYGVVESASSLWPVLGMMMITNDDESDASIKNDPRVAVMLYEFQQVVSGATRVDCEESAYERLFEMCAGKDPRSQATFRNHVHMIPRGEPRAAKVNASLKHMHSSSGMKEVNEQYDLDQLIPCDKCDSGNTIPIPRGCVCMCKSIASVPRFTSKIGRQLFSAGTSFGVQEPWLQMRLNHALRVDCPWAPHFKYVQVIGGGGNCDPGLYICAEPRELDREDHNPGKEGKAGLRAHGLYLFMDVAAEGGYEWSTLEYVEEHDMPTVKGSSADPGRWMMPHFAHAKFAPEGEHHNMRRWHPNVEEMAFLQAACVVVCAVLKSGEFASPPYCHHGDHRQFYRMDTTVEIPDAITPPGYKHSGEGPCLVKVKFPCTDVPSERSWLMSNAVCREPHPGVEHVNGRGKSEGG
eukprot:CAMPEP_0197587242 /NCGR_PEP_ID=MMETSP1326-20131121/8933_1 /TAXON_ID=1155430 /ORGANISM="Genus nov. species nov., Strain RCC2288" /LENGTH=494 /DNA_ID=CAMNT_0043151945 /DNA_START=33 /DNA_END=1514 /DNA_ORIENTATION=-